MLFDEPNGPASECKSYLVASGAQAALIDPLLARVPAYLEVLARRGLTLVYAIDTHTHADHLSGSRELSAQTGCRMAGAPRGSVDLPLGDGDVLALGELRLVAWASPGHTADSLVLLFEGRVLTGDTLLIGATGRTDLPSGDAEAEWRSVQRLLTLPDETLVFPCHDYAGKTCSTIGEERRTNPRLLASRDEFLASMRAPRPARPTLLDEALSYNTRPRRT